jgi:hypothetical protein
MIMLESEKSATMPSFTYEKGMKNKVGFGEEKIWVIHP